MTLTDVANDLGITRQTVYRYFSTTADLLRVISFAHAGDYLDRLVAHLARYDDPVDIVVRSIVYSVEHLPNERCLTALAAAGERGTFIEEITSPTAIEFAVAVLRRLDVDWTALGIDEHEIRELAELAMRLIQSFVLSPGRLRTSTQLRRYLHRWLAPALTAPSSTVVRSSATTSVPS